MKHIKPGRGPSMMSGVVGIFMIGFGILWTVMAAQAGGVFALFGVLWTGIAVVITVYSFRNATKKNRYSAYDITDSDEEPDPLNRRFGDPAPQAPPKEKTDCRFCPHCGVAVDSTYAFCHRCGQKLP